MQHSLGIVLFTVDLAVSQEAGGVAVKLQCAHATPQTGGVPRAAAHLQQVPVRYALTARAASAVLRLKLNNGQTYIITFKIKDVVT